MDGLALIAVASLRKANPVFLSKSGSLLFGSIRV